MGIFDSWEIEPAKPRRDTELTLRSTTLLAIFFGLVLICGLCFGLGYAVGRHGSQEPSAASQAAAGAQTSLQADGSRSKPSAITQNNIPPPPPSAVADLPASAASDTNPVASSQSSAPVSSAGSLLPQPQVLPALPAAANLPHPVQPAAGLGGGRTVQPALPPAGVLMVQIAAVTNPEDAEVLVNAVRKRGYAVIARREATDSLIHVRIGPFSSRDEANKWSQKLLGDGYNAIVQP
jgi:cell division septation protein DedD